MTKNTKTFILLVLVIGIWGFIGYKIIKSLNPNVEPIKQISDVHFKPVEYNQKDTFSIIANYRDPFLGTVKPSKKVIKKVQTNRTKNKIDISISYTGRMGNPKGKDNIYFITINGNQHIMKLKQKVEEVQLVSGSKDYVILRYKNQNIKREIQK